jgi:ABC-type amino acid transport substrate-binding protein
MDKASSAFGVSDRMDEEARVKWTSKGDSAGNRGPAGFAWTRRGFGIRFAAAAIAGASLTQTDARAAVDPSLLAPEIQAIKRRGKLIVGLTSFDSPPFYYSKDGGAPKGYDIELAKDIANGLEVELALDRRAEDFNGVVDLVMRGEVDIATSKLSYTVKRAVGVLFSRPTIELRHGLLANRVAIARLSNGHDAEDAINRDYSGSIGVIAFSSYADFARQLFAKADIRPFKSWDDAVDAVNKGAVDIAYRDELEIKRIMRLHPELHLNLRSVLISDKRDYICAALPYSSAQLGRLADDLISRRRKLDANQLLDAYVDIFAS